MNQPAKYHDAGCCKESEGLVFWHPKGEIKRSTDRPNPPRNGWTMSVDDISLVNVAYCPFCGIKLSKLTEDHNGQRPTGVA